MKKWMIFAAAIVCLGLLAWITMPEKEPQPAVYDWGITMTATDITPTGCTLQVAQSGGSPTGSLMCGCDYFVEQLADGVWTALDTPENLSWTAEGYSLNDCIQTFDLNWESIYGTLPDGTYRIGKAIMGQRAPGDSVQQIYYTEPFTIN